MIGILLAAGNSRRFGHTDKLLHTLADGRSIALTAAETLLAAIPLSIAVIRPHKLALQQQLQAIGMHVVVCQESQQQMGDSIAAALHFSLALSAATAEHLSIDPASSGFIIALADMPYIRPATIQRVADTLRADTVSKGAAIVVPTYQPVSGDKVASTIQRGHPVGFSAHFAEELASLHGDEGARSVLSRHQANIRLLACDDSGIVMDIDTLQDIA